MFSSYILLLYILLLLLLLKDDIGYINNLNVLVCSWLERFGFHHQHSKHVVLEELLLNSNFIRLKHNLAANFRRQLNLE